MNHTDRDWMVDALCAQIGGDSWFAPDTKDNRETIRDAKRACRMCDVRNECLEYAIVNDERFGIWGGVGPRTRTRLRQQRGIPASRGPETWHGTEAGARRHSRYGEKACGSCSAAARRAKLIRGKM